MKIKFLRPDKISQSGIKVLLQKSGKITFNKGAVEQFEITAETNVKVGIDSENKSEKAIFLVKTEENDLMGKKINQTGGKTILSVAYALEELGIDYKNKKYLSRADILDIDNDKVLKVSFIEQ